ncbi:hypothetical protein FHT87_003221 [Rhizobium sp. BK316]|uniref:hypothetical protein n=1 Tax=Rhizobium sp. BK316 TaxID=2587053 RepID=UPI001609CB3F|nr:hypothetical protein [Rhizobium sp. BK316]MBB3409302.1 hypothetical protein [Rhizobium sp. BK316]
MLFSWPLGRPFPFGADYIFTARSNYQRPARRQAGEAPPSAVPDTSVVINPSPGIATKIDGRNGRGHSIHFLEIQSFYRR